jgi:hypothetical protein
LFSNFLIRIHNVQKKWISQIICLTRNCGGNVADCGILGIRVISFLNDNLVPKNATNLAWGGPKNEVNQWIEWDCKTSQIEPTHEGDLENAAPQIKEPSQL